MKVTNRTWSRSYELLEEIEAGIVLTGAEAKSTYLGKVKLEAAYGKIKGDEVWLNNMEVFKYQFDGSREYNPTRSRKLLLNRREILRWQTKMASQPGLTLVPIAVYTKGTKIKVKLGLCRGRKETEQRRREKDKTIKRQVDREVRDAMKR